MLCAAQPGKKRNHFFSSYFLELLLNKKNSNPSLRGTYSHQNVKGWTKNVPGKDIFNLQNIFCPINQDNSHWALAVICMMEKRIQYYDSLWKTDMKILKSLLQYLKDEYKAKKGGDMNDEEWKLPREMCR